MFPIQHKIYILHYYKIHSYEIINPLLGEYPEKSIFIHIPSCFDQEDMYKKYAKKIEKIIAKILTKKD